MSFASNGYGRQCLATQINISYHRGVLPGDLIAAVATEINRTHDSRTTGSNYRPRSWWRVLPGPPIEPTSGTLVDEAWPDTWRETY